MISAAAFLATLILAKWAITGAQIWLRHGYDGAEFTFSNEYEDALSHWKQNRREERERRSQEADQSSTSPV